jgi:hypothetical protein
VEVDDLFSMKGLRYQKSDSAYRGDGNVIYVLPITKRARWKGKLVFDKQDRFMHPAAIAKNERKNKYYISLIPRLDLNFVLGLRIFFVVWSGTNIGDPT